MANRVLIGALAFTWLFFGEYLPPFERVHIPYDLDGFHYPLLDYAFQELRDGRFPEWDPTVYCGLSFVGNPQTALFYPGTWLLFLANAAWSHLSYSSLELFVFAHVWLAFAFTWLWLRGKGIGVLPAVLGAAIYAYGGPTVVQLQHLGWIIAIAWMPFAVWGIDQAVAGGTWRPMWKVAAASAMCFLGGYPPAWFAFVSTLPAYALFRRAGWRPAVWTLGALGVSVLLVMVQLLPAMEASVLVRPEFHYGGGVWEADFFRSFLVPRFHDFSLYAHPDGGAEYLYLGAPALFGLLRLIRGGGRLARVAAPMMWLLVAALFWMINPFGLLGRTLISMGRLAEICRDYYYVSPAVLAVAGLSAVAIDDFLSRKDSRSRPLALWLRIALGLALVGWAVAQLTAWGNAGGAALRTGWASAFDSLAMLLLFTLALVAWRSSAPAGKVWLAIALLFAVGVEYKTFGTLTRLNAHKGGSGAISRDARHLGIAEADIAMLRSQRQYRVALDLTSGFPGSLRHLRLTTPQGFDPLLPEQYRTVIESLTPFRSNREFEFAPSNQEALRLLGVRYFFTTDAGPNRAALLTDPAFVRYGSGDAWVQPFELRDALPPYRWEDGVKGTVQLRNWAPGDRLFQTDSDAPARFVFIEQFFTGWEAFVDGNRVPIHRWREAFQAIDVPAGRHEVRFRFRSGSLRWGAAISLVTLLAGCWVLWPDTARSGVREPRAERLLRM